MGNRHGHKQLRLAIRARMAKTGETHQQARARILESRAREAEARAVPQAQPVQADLLSVHYFGQPIAIATFAIAGRMSALVVSSPHRLGPFPLNPLIGLGSSRALH